MLDQSHTKRDHSVQPRRSPGGACRKKVLHINAEMDGARSGWAQQFPHRLSGARLFPPLFAGPRDLT